MTEEQAIKMIAEIAMVIEEQRAELQVMFNRCITYRSNFNCSECKLREKCENTRSMFSGYYLSRGELVRKEGETIVPAYKMDEGGKEIDRR